jgi:tetratricopeptide (TPR) repeat protein
MLKFVVSKSSCFQKLLDSGSQDLGHFTECGFELYNVSDYEIAIMAFTAGIEINPIHAIGYFGRGNAKLGLGRIEEAILDYDIAIQIDPNYAFAYVNRGSAKLGIGLTKEAILDFDKSILFSPNYAIAYNNRGNAKSDLGLKAEAILDFDVSIQLNPNLVQAYNNRGLVKSDLGLKAEAILDFDVSIRLDPNLVQAYNNRGLAKSDLGLKAEAISDFDVSIQLNPNLVQAYYNRGLAKSNLGLKDEAILDFDVSIRLDPNLAIAYCDRGLVKSDLGLQTEAILDFDVSIQLDPNLAKAYCNRGVAKLRQGRKEEAILDFDVSIQLDPNLAKAYCNRGLAKSNLGLKEEAILDFDVSIQLDPNLAKAYCNRGLAKSDLGQNEEAILDCNVSIQIDPNLASAYNNRGVAKLRQGRKEEAILDFNVSIQIDPNLASAYNNRGGAKSSQGRKEEAILDFNVSIRLDPNLAVAYCNRGRDKIDLGKTLEANVDFYRAADLLKNNFASLSGMQSMLQHFNFAYPAPFHLQNIITSNPAIRTTLSHAQLVTENEKQCRPLNLWLAWQGVKYPNPNLHVFWMRALVHYHTGDPITSFHILDKLDGGENVVFVQQYLFVLSADAILKDERESIKQFAKEYAVQFSLENNDDDAQNYWAARLLTYCNEPLAALECLRRVNSKDIWVFLAQAEAQELAGINSARSLQSASDLQKNIESRGEEYIKISSLRPEDGVEDYLINIESATKYYDLEEKFNSNFADGKIKPRFWEIWDASALEEPLRQHRMQELELKLKSDFEKALDATLENGIPDEHKFKSEKQPYRWEAYKALKTTEDLVFEIGLRIYQGTLPKDTLAELIEYFYLDKKLPADEVFYLYFYLAVCKKYTGSNHAIGSGGEEAVKVFLENFIKNAIEYSFIGGLTSIGFLFSPLAAGVGLGLAALGRQFLTESMEPTIKTYQEFKKEFKEFIFAEFTRLGAEKFYQTYPLQGFDDFSKS